MWKERKSILRYRGSRGRFLLTLLSPVLFAVVFPWQWGPDWVEEIPSVILSAIIPLILSGITVPDSFAGERERHTLDTLLASRLPDRAILFGKLVTSIGLAWFMALGVAFISLVTVNIAHWSGEFLFYTPQVLLADVLLSLLMAILCSGTGVLISMRAKTVQETSQVLMAIFLVPIVVVQVVLIAFKDQLGSIIDKIDGQQVLLFVLAVLAVLSAAVLSLVLARFRRARLSLS
jgi:ABC-2 type transport system permease protein